MRLRQSLLAAAAGALALAGAAAAAGPSVVVQKVLVIPDYKPFTAAFTVTLGGDPPTYPITLHSDPVKGACHVSVGCKSEAYTFSDVSQALILHGAARCPARPRKGSTATYAVWAQDNVAHVTPKKLVKVVCPIR